MRYIILYMRHARMGSFPLTPANREWVFGRWVVSLFLTDAQGNEHYSVYRRKDK